MQEGDNKQEESNASLPVVYTLVMYANEKRFFMPSLFEWGLDYEHNNKCVKMPYYLPDGTIQCIRYRGLNRRFWWKSKGANSGKPTLYGLWRLEEYDDKFIHLVEGESDTHTLWHMDLPAVGLPGASMWDDDKYAKYLERFETIYVWQEQDQGGETLVNSLKDSCLKDKIRIVNPHRMDTELDGFKDISDLWTRAPDIYQPYAAGPKEFALQQVSTAIFEYNSVPIVDIVAEENDLELKESWELCKDLATKPDIMRELLNIMNRYYLVGEDQNASIVFLAMITRFLPKPCGVIIKGHSAGGKSTIFDTVLRCFNEGDDYEYFSGMSGKALINEADSKSYSNKFIFFAEAQGMADNDASYMLRTLQSEGKLKYSKSIKEDDGNWVTKTISKDGPTGVFTSTTASKIHAENETRNLSLYINDTPEQTRQVMVSLGKKLRDRPLTRYLEGVEDDPEIKKFQALSKWLWLNDKFKVRIDYAEGLGMLIPPDSVRLRRDESQILSLIQGHAILHQCNREIDDDGYIIATYDDYSAIRELINSSISENIGRTVRATIRETVMAVVNLIGPDASVIPPVTVTTGEIAQELQLDESTVRTRVQTAMSDGYLENLTKGAGTYRIRAGSVDLPEDRIFLPTVEDLKAACNEAMDSTDEQHTLPSDDLIPHESDLLTFSNNGRIFQIIGSEVTDESETWVDIDDEQSGNQETPSEFISPIPTRIFSQAEKTVHDAIYGPKEWHLSADGTWSLAEGSGGSITI